MPLLQRNWKPIIIVLAVFGTTIFIFFKNNMPPEPVIIYKATPLSSDQKRTNAENAATGTKHTHINEHPHDNTPDTYISNDTSNDKIYDWREDKGVDSPSTEDDPWKQAYMQKTEEKSLDSGDDRTSPPQDWYKTEDPMLYAQYLQTQLIKQFGDIPQIHIFVEWQKKRRQGLPIRNAAEYITFLEAQYYLWPSEVTLRTLKTLQEEKASGVQIIFKK